MRTAEEIVATIPDEFDQLIDGSLVRELEAWRREILTEAAERAVQWWSTPMQEWTNERLMNPKKSIRRAVMGEEAEG